MEWNLKDAISYYRTLGAPRDQSALISLLREVQQENDGKIPAYILGQIAQDYAVKESLLLTIIRRIPSLRLDNGHCLELCAGQNCAKHTALAAHAEKLHAASGQKFTLRFSPCMRMCGKGPNIKWDGQLYNKADASLLEKLLRDNGIDF